jgi:hypothetical protein
VNLLIELHYLPSQSFFCEWAKAEQVTLEVQEHYQKQSYRNRCYILGANKIESLIVPIQNGNSHGLIRDMQIDYSSPWVQTHLRTISSAYGKAAYFEHFFDPLQRVYDKKSRFLFDLNLELLTLCLKLLKWEAKFEFSTEFKVTESLTDEYTDRRSVIHPKKKGLTPEYSYTQVFGKEFVPDLSILDLLFCEGLQAGPLIRKAVRSNRG